MQITAAGRRRGVQEIQQSNMEKKWMELFTAELDVLETALRQYAWKRTTRKKEKDICERLLKAIDQKDEAYLVY